MIDELLLLSGNDLPFPEARLTIHQPRLREIAYITEQNFWLGCQLLKFDKQSLPDEDKNELLNISNFNIIMVMIHEKNVESQQARINVLSILALLFPTSEITLNKKVIQLKNHQTGEVSEINQENFDAFKAILIDMFCLIDKGKQYNPSGELAKKIVNKLKRGQEKKAKLAPAQQKVAILSRYISILAVGQQKNINELMDYTVYQLMDEFNRYELKLHYDTWQRYKIAGATGMEDPEDWLKDLYDKNSKKEESYVKI